ncbi:hypothetical protein BASA50_007194 [Batrachochytrium salamandrivorans]|uniref:BZIP domain-containing protein n=1 Tax=Batrachochytrium salamandrivorans TaxID=1357716 RepID=A0ABQ8F7M0_9FUNG|nr:hypothetical protein BASA50_007194 [Batrachochytrium salamandrivorans]
MVAATNGTTLSTGRQIHQQPIRSDRACHTEIQKEGSLRQATHCRSTAAIQQNHPERESFYKLKDVGIQRRQHTVSVQGLPPTVSVRDELESNGSHESMRTTSFQASQKRPYSAPVRRLIPDTSKPTSSGDLKRPPLTSQPVRPATTRLQTLSRLHPPLPQNSRVDSSSSQRSMAKPDLSISNSAAIIPIGLIGETLPPPTTTTAHKRYTSVYPCASKLLAQKWDNTARRRHLEKLETMKACVDNVQSNRSNILAVSSKRLLAQQERAKRIEKENLILLERMRRMFATPSTYTLANSRTMRDRTRKAKASQKKQTELHNQINRDNLILIHRVETKEGFYTIKDCERDSKQHLRYLLNMTRFPEAYVEAIQRKKLDVGSADSKNDNGKKKYENTTIRNPSSVRDSRSANSSRNRASPSLAGDDNVETISDGLKNVSLVNEYYGSHRNISNSSLQSKSCSTNGEMASNESNTESMYESESIDRTCSRSPIESQEHTALKNISAQSHTQDDSEVSIQDKLLLGGDVDSKTPLENNIDLFELESESDIEGYENSQLEVKDDYRYQASSIANETWQPQYNQQLHDSDENGYSGSSSPVGFSSPVSNPLNLTNLQEHSLQSGTHAILNSADLDFFD